MRIKPKLTIAAVAVGLAGLLPVHGANSSLQVLAKTATDAQMTIAGFHLAEEEAEILARTENGKLTGIGMNGARKYAPAEITASGVDAFRLGPFKVFKIRKGWPQDPRSVDENPAMDPSRNRLDQDGGYVTLTYIHEGKLMGPSKYRHLSFEVRKASTGFWRAYTREGAFFNHVFVFENKGKSGIREIRPVSAAEFARLRAERPTGMSAEVSPAAVHVRAFKGEWASMGVQSDTGTGSPILSTALGAR